MTQAQARTPVSAVTGMLPDELESDFIGIGEPKYCARQLLEWIYDKRVVRYEDMTNLGKGLRGKLQQWRALTTMECVTVQGSKDTTRKFLFRLHDGRYVETVLIPASKSNKTRQVTSLAWVVLALQTHSLRPRSSG